MVEFLVLSTCTYSYLRDVLLTLVLCTSSSIILCYVPLTAAGSQLPPAVPASHWGKSSTHNTIIITSRDAQRKARYSDRARPSVCYLAWA